MTLTQINSAYPPLTAGPASIQASRRRKKPAAAMPKRASREEENWGPIYPCAAIRYVIKVTRPRPIFPRGTGTPRDLVECHHSTGRWRSTHRCVSTGHPAKKPRRSGAVIWVYGEAHQKRAASTSYADEARGVERNRSFSTLSTASGLKSQGCAGNYPRAPFGCLPIEHRGLRATPESKKQAPRGGLFSAAAGC
jgi:hypothetical protein